MQVRLLHQPLLLSYSREVGMMDRPDWRKAISAFEIIDLRSFLKDGPYRYMHRDECCCAGCCGVELAKEIEEYYETRPASVTDA